MKNTMLAQLSVVCVFLLATVTARSAGQYDGTYVGRSALYGSNNANCVIANKTVRIANGTLSTSLFYADYTTTVAADGTFGGSFVPKTANSKKNHSAPDAVQVTGKITGDTMELNYANSSCKLHATLTKQ